MDNIVTKVQTKKNLFFDKNAETNIKVKNTNNLPTTNTFDIMYKDENKIEYLINLKNKIECLDKNLHIKILKILKQNNIDFSENKNGIFVNLNNLSMEIIRKINNLLMYLTTQETNLNEIENIKHEINNDFFKYKKKDNKQKTIQINNVNANFTS